MPIEAYIGFVITILTVILNQRALVKKMRGQTKSEDEGRLLEVASERFTKLNQILKSYQDDLYGVELESMMAQRTPEEIEKGIRQMVAHYQRTLTLYLNNKFYFGEETHEPLAKVAAATNEAILEVKNVLITIRKDGGIKNEIPSGHVIALQILVSKNHTFSGMFEQALQTELSRLNTKITRFLEVEN